LFSYGENELAAIHFNVRVVADKIIFATGGTLWAKPAWETTVCTSKEAPAYDVPTTNIVKSPKIDYLASFGISRSQTGAPEQCLGCVAQSRK
jgi:hypothetical protein